MNSIIQDEKCCIVCYNNQGLKSYPVFGNGQEWKSEQYSLKVWLCPLHDIKQPGMDAWLKHLAEKAFEKHFPDKDFHEEFGA